MRSHLMSLGLAATMAAATLSASPTAGQSVLSDYESSAKAMQAREAAIWRLDFRPPTQVLQQTVSQLRAAAGLTDAQRAEADALVQGAAAKPEADARRDLWRAAAVLLGQPWSPGREYVSALGLSTAAPVLTGGHVTASFTPEFAATAPAGARFDLDLVRSEATTSATPKRGAVVRRLASGSLDGAGPQAVAIDLDGVPDGAYLLIAHVQAGDGADGEIARPVYLVRDLAARHAALTAELARIKGHDDARWTAEYPFALAEALNAGRREVIAYDFPAAIARSNAIVAALRAGRDVVRHARGLQDRAYRFEPTGELVPYQVFTPSNWTPSRRWPLVVALHGANLDERNMLGRAGGEMQKLAEQHGFVVVAPLGYRLNSAYGSERGMSKAIVGDQLERRHRSELDVMQVLARVRAEYAIDPHRLYLTGNSMGGGGTWWIGGRNPGVWAAIAPAAYGGVEPQDVAALSRVPVLAVVGDHDELGMLDRVKASVATLRAGGANPDYLEVKGGTHASAFDTAMPQIFEFFEKHAK